MTVSIDDILQVRAKTEYQGQVCRNVFHYRVLSFESLVDENFIAESFRLWYEAVINPMLLEGCNMVETQVHNLTDGLGYGVDTTLVAGNVVGLATPSFVAWAFRLNRSTLITRHGQKRFAGVAEEMVSGNSPTGGILTTAPNAAAGMADGLIVTGTVDHDFELQPVIVGRTLVDGVYQIDLTKINVVSSVDFTGVSSQVTRKAGRGE